MFYATLHTVCDYVETRLVHKMSKLVKLPMREDSEVRHESKMPPYFGVIIPIPDFPFPLKSFSWRW